MTCQDRKILYFQFICKILIPNFSQQNLREYKTACEYTNKPENLGYATVLQKFPVPKVSWYTANVWQIAKLKVAGKQKFG